MRPCASRGRRSAAVDGGCAQPVSATSAEQRTRIRSNDRVYPARPVRVVCAAAVAASLLFLIPIRAQERPEAAEPATIVAQLDVDGVREPLPVTQGTAGPLFLLEPIVARLGARLDVVPLERSYRLRIAETDVVLGPSTQAM